MTLKGRRMSCEGRRCALTCGFEGHRCAADLRVSVM